MSAVAITISTAMSTGTVLPATISRSGTAQYVRPSYIDQISVVVPISISQGDQTVTPPTINDDEG